MANFWDSIFGSNKTTLTPDKEPWQLAAGKSVADWAKKYIPEYQPGKGYEGQFTAGMTTPEQMSQDWLMKYLTSPGLGENYQLAADELKKTMTGKYDPFTSEFYKPTRAGMQYEIQDAIDAARRGQGARGTYFQDTSMREENRMRERGMNTLMQILGGMGETERGRRFEAIPQAMALESWAMGEPLRKTEAGQTYGALPRIVEQMDLEAKYKDFLRKQEELSGAVSAGQSVFGTGINYGVKEWEAPSAFERIMSTAGGIAGNMAGGLLPWNK